MGFKSYPILSKWLCKEERLSADQGEMEIMAAAIRERLTLYDEKRI